MGEEGRGENNNQPPQAPIETSPRFPRCLVRTRLDVPCRQEDNWRSGCSIAAHVASDAFFLHLRPLLRQEAGTRYSSTRYGAYFLNQSVLTISQAYFLPHTLLNRGSGAAALRPDRQAKAPTPGSNSIDVHPIQCVLRYRNPRPPLTPRLVPPTA